MVAFPGMFTLSRTFQKILVCSLITCGGVGYTVNAVTVAPSEQVTAAIWAKARLMGETSEIPQMEGIVVFANHDPVQRRGRNGSDMNISGKKYNRGLYCHADSHLHVNLPAAGKRFIADIGVDTNGDTYNGKGSVKFIVKSGDKELYASDVIREGGAPIPLSIDLSGSKSFELIVDSCGEISCDQSDWANARVELEDGKIVWLDELPFTNPSAAAPCTDPFFSFNYDGKPSAELLKDWNLTRAQKSLDDNRVRHELVWTDPKTNLEIRCNAVEYKDYPTVEWTLYFKNKGTEKTPILSDIKSIDATFSGDSQQATVLHHNTGSPCRNDDYKLYNDPLNEATHLNSAGGRGTDGEFPYFNLEFSANSGAIVVVGWPGQWSADFTPVVADGGAKGVKVVAGQELTHFYLNPGEEIRTPLMVVQFWNRGYLNSQNVWRSWMLKHNVPHPYGQVAPLHWAACSSHQYAEMIKADTASQINYIQRYLNEGIKLDYWWMDAGWYVNEWGWPHTGTWEVDKKRFPNGLREITDYAHSKGVKAIVWFEPERVAQKTWLTDNHPEWLLVANEAGDRLLNLGNPEAWNWVVNHIDGILVNEGIDLYRQDYNIAPLAFWRKADTPDRQGITENKYVVGYLAYWDELLKRHPNMLIDSCSSGGRRNDLETMRRSVPLLRSDYIFEPVGNQGHTYGIASWIPLFGTGQRETDSYNRRSTMCPFMNTCYEMRPTDADYSANRQVMQEWTLMKPYYYGDYYPLTPYSLDATQWVAWQFNREDLQAGVVQAFRHSESIYDSIRVRLYGLDENARYLVKDVDGAFSKIVSGSELMQKGLRISSEEIPQAFIVTYKKVSE